MPPARGEGMTGSPIRPPRARETGPEDDNDPPPEQTPKQHKPLSISLPSTASAKRRRRQGPTAATRSGLRPSLDPDADSDTPSQDKEARRPNQNNTTVGLDRPLSFRNDLRLYSGAKGNRTPDLLDANESRYQLRHSP